MRTVTPHPGQAGEPGWREKAFPEQVVLGHVSLQITRAISEVVLALRSTEELRQLLPHLLPSLLRWASEMLGGERQLLLMTSWKQLHVEKPCR